MERAKIFNEFLTQKNEKRAKEQMKQLVQKAKTEDANTYQINGLILKQTVASHQIFMKDLKEVLSNIAKQF